MQKENPVAEDTLLEEEIIVPPPTPSTPEQDEYCDKRIDEMRLQINEVRDWVFDQLKDYPEMVPYLMDKYYFEGVPYIDWRINRKYQYLDEKPEKEDRFLKGELPIQEAIDYGYLKVDYLAITAYHDILKVHVTDPKEMATFEEDFETIWCQRKWDEEHEERMNIWCANTAREFRERVERGEESPEITFDDRYADALWEQTGRDMDAVDEKKKRGSTK